LYVHSLPYDEKFQSIAFSNVCGRFKKLNVFALCEMQLVIEGFNVNGTDLEGIAKG
jgi:hypothetical protein